MKFYNDHTAKIKLSYHFWFWGIYFLLNFIRWGAYFNDYNYSFKSNILEFIVHIPLAYFNINFLIPKFVLNKKYVQYLSYLLVVLFIAYVIRASLNFYLIGSIWPESGVESKPYSFNYIVAVIIGELYVLAIVSSVYLTTVWISERNRNKSLVEAQLKIKLDFLKLQIQPHFFFNTLNNLYSLSLHSSSKVPNAIIKLSNLMEYVLYDVNDVEKVDLLKEIECIHNYIEIEKLRFTDVISVINIESSIENLKIPPLLLISFVENAFKHGGNKNPNLIIKINIQRIEDRLQFQIINNFIVTENLKEKEGIGLYNTKNRLSLLFGNDYVLNQKVKFNFYIIQLEIPI
ncbi:MAG: histidine kinase [Limnohabitans sp.]|nr:histidine kinase [Limnohabitans sp.]